VAWFDTRLSRLLGCRYPVVQAPMAGVNTPALVAGVSNAGGLGSLGAAMLSPGQLREQLGEVRRRTDEPFAVNLFAPLETPEAPAAVEAMLERLRPWRESLGLGPGSAPPRPASEFEDQLACLLEQPPAMFSITFGAPPAEALAALKQAGVTVIATATTTAEAATLEEAGCDAVVAQGSEAGGHRGTFGGSFDAAQVGTMALVPQVVDRVELPVIAAGGIMDGRGIAAALALGADGVQMGTAFIGCDESGAPAAYVDSLTDSADSDTTVTAAFTGRPARAVRTRWVEEVERSGAEIPPYPVQAMLMMELRTAGLERDRLEPVMRLAGQGAPMIRRGPAADLVASLVAETEASLPRPSGG
jgi:nitronate monooxygenase